MARNKKTTESQYAWVQNGCLPDSKYQPMPHKEMNAAQYRSARKVRGAQIFPTILIALDVLAAAVYGQSSDIRKVIYWLAAAVLTAAVTY